MITVRKAAPVDLTGMTDTLQQAFFDDPVVSFLLPDERSRRWRTAKLFETQLKGHHLPLNTVWTTPDHAGAALWAPPDHWRLTPALLVRNTLPLVRAFGRRLPTALRCVNLVERQHPVEPHWYLAVLGTAPRHQGKGVGSALLAPVLERCDAEGVPAYLESSKKENLPFYGRHGFQVRGEISLPGGPTVWLMWREPKGPAEDR